MIIYQASKREFLHHALRDDIEDVVTRHYRSATGHGVSPGEVRAWKHSLLEMAKVLGDEEIPEDAGVAIEYQLPQSAKRIDFVIPGEDAAARSKVTSEYDFRVFDNPAELHALVELENRANNQSRVVASYC